MSDSVTVFTRRNFSGQSRTLGIGGHRFFTPDDFNDVIVSIKVPAGLVAMVYEHADDGGGYGVYLDLLEDCADLGQFNFRNKISYVTVFQSPNSTGLVWVRNSIQNGEFVSGHWERQRVPPRPPNPVPVVGPPAPPHASPGPTVIQVDGPRSVITSLGQHAPADSAFWEHAVTKQMGVIGNDFRGIEEIGSASFERASNWAVVPNFFNFWTPQKQPNDHRAVVYFKRTLAGTVDHVKVSNITEIFVDHDVCIHVKPDAGYQYLITDGHPREYTNLMELQWTLSAHTSGQPDCGDSGTVESFQLVEAEIQPHANPSAPTAQTLHDLIAAKATPGICVYGPWIFDRGHCCHSEIHPAEQIWWRENLGGNARRYALNVFCDGSRRFWWRDQMDDGTKLKPWGAPPIKGLFAIAFEAKLGKPPLRFEVADVSRRNVTPAPGGNQVYELLYGSRRLVAFVPHTDAFKVSFEKVGQVGDVVRGFLVLETSVGTVTQTRTQVVLTTPQGSGLPPREEVIEVPPGSDVNAVPEFIERRAFAKVAGHYMFTVSRSSG